jgi:glycosyltransferase involved in cell wall biosynthesis
MLLPALRLLRLLRRERPAILYAFLPAQTTLAALLQPLLPTCRLVFGLRSSFDYREADWLQRLVFRLETGLARRAQLIIANSEAGRQAALARGMPADRLIMIGNLIDTARFRPDAEQRRRQRDAWGIAAESPLIGMAARLDPIKGHGTFLAAARRLRQCRPDARFVLVGSGNAWYRRHLEALAAKLGLAEALIWAGASHHMPAVYNAMDIATLVSDAGEGFPNAIAEAMATGVPVVATDTGDAAMLIGPTGLVIPPRDPAALAQAWAALLESDRGQLGRSARQRISAEFDSGRVLDDNVKHLTALAATSTA